jgi:ABC-type phosphate/phosphonate transport system substrate-binding protein
MATSITPLPFGTARIAVLPMYDAPHLRAANDELWGWLAAWLGMRIDGVPATLDRGIGHAESWQDPRLLLGQACEYPLATRYGQYVLPLMTPTYDAPGCGAGTYRSQIVVRRDDTVSSLAGLRGRICAVNEADSNSGMNLLRAALAPVAGGRCMFREVILTGAHAASAQAVAEGTADVAAIDCVTWAHLGDASPELTGRLRVLDQTPASPALPFVTSRRFRGSDPRALRTGLAAAMDAPELAACRRTLRLVAVEHAAGDDFATVRGYAARAAELGYPVLC